MLYEYQPKSGDYYTCRRQPFIKIIQIEDVINNRVLFKFKLITRKQLYSRAFKSYGNTEIENIEKGFFKIPKLICEFLELK